MGDTDRDLELTTGSAGAVFSSDNGGRLASLTVDGFELLVGPDADAMRWGSYPMAPWAGRVDHGRFVFEGVEHRLPVTLGPHAIHGTAYTEPWDVVDAAQPAEGGSVGALAVELGSPWPFPARLTQEAELTDDSLRITMRLAAAVDQPAMLGWHPWFRRRLGGAVDGPEVELEVAPRLMFELGEDMIPTGKLVAPGPLPWDNCFEVQGPPVLRWPGRLELTLSSDCAYWTIFTHPEHALCVEPQTEAPDVFNRTPAVVAAGTELTATFELAWRRL